LDGRSKFIQRVEGILFFFPIQLLFLHLKRNHFLLLFWLLIFGFVLQFFGTKFGVGYLFLYPEYLGEVNFWSHAILGFSCGGFIMAFNMYSYVMHGYKFSFIATVSKPFYKFSINNFIIPAAFVLAYTIKAILFQYNREFESVLSITFNMLGFYSGMFIFFIFSFYYFFKTNKDLQKITGKSEELLEAELREIAIQTTLHNNPKWSQLFNTDTGWNVGSYLAGPFKIKIARESKHYDADLLKRVLSQNHINASFFEFAMILSFLILGSLAEYDVFLIPAGASIFLLLTMLLMLISAIYSWLRGWTLTFLIVMLIGLNYLSEHTEIFSYKNFAYGLDYSGELAPYTLANVHRLQTDTLAQKADILTSMQMLNNWKNKNIRYLKPGVKPKMVIVCTSGGGVRSALWTLHVLQKADSLSNGSLMRLTHLMTGSSGGMLGAAFFRELYLRKQDNPRMDIYDKKYKDQIGKDILNPVAFTIATNDIFIRYRKFTDGPYSYTIDRGYMFEKHMNLNLDSAFNKRLIDYTVPEKTSQVPMLLLCPTIINDGRRMIISSQPVAYLTNCQPEERITSIPSEEYVEFTKLFEHQNAWNLRFSSAVRMNASFPYVMPMVTLPSEPSIEVMDAGYRDNYGIRLALRFLFSFRRWINANTDGVIIVQIRDRQKEIDETTRKNSVFNRIVRPLGNLYDNIFNTQDFDNDQLLQSAAGWLDCQLDVINFYLNQNDKERVSLSWHLTKLEKNQVITSLDRIPQNREAMMRLMSLIK
jgi:hypothetical protein